MANRFPLWLTFLLLSFTPACGDEERPPKKVPVPEETEPTTELGQDGLPPLQDPLGSSEITTVDCATVTPDVIVPLTDVRDFSSLISVRVGGVVQWRNDVDGTHTVTSEDPANGSAGERFDLGSLAPGETACARFDIAGDFDYFCRLHSNQMHDDRIHVTDAP